MEIYTASQAREKLYKLIDYVADSHEPVFVTGRRNKVVIISEEDFKSIQETLHLLSIPGMRESIMKGREQPLDELSEDIDWSE